MSVVCIKPVIQHANRVFSAPYYRLTWPVWLNHTFFLNYLINGTIFRNLLNIKHVLIFSTTFSPNTSNSTNSPRYFKCTYRLQVKYVLILLHFN